jgi:hypothetical protein
MTLLLLTSIYISWPYLIFKFSIARSLEQKGTINLSIWPTHLQIYVVKFDPTWETPLINLDLNPLDFFFVFFRKSNWSESDSIRIWTIWNSKWSDIRQSKIRPDLKPNNSKTENDPRSRSESYQIWTRMTQNSRWHETRPDLNLNDLKPEMT